MAIAIPENPIHADYTRVGAKPAECALLLELMLQDFSRLGCSLEMKLAGVPFVSAVKRTDEHGSGVVSDVCAEFELVQGGGRMIVFISRKLRNVVRMVYCSDAGAVEVTQVTTRSGNITKTIGRHKGQRVSNMLYDLGVHAVKVVERELSKQLASSTK